MRARNCVGGLPPLFLRGQPWPFGGRGQLKPQTSTSLTESACPASAQARCRCWARSSRQRAYPGR